MCLAWQLPNGVRTNGVFAEVPQYTMIRVRTCLDKIDTWTGRPFKRTWVITRPPKRETVKRTKNKRNIYNGHSDHPKEATMSQVQKMRVIQSMSPWSRARSLSLSIYIYIYAFVYVCVTVCMYTYAYIYIYIHTCVFTCMYIYIYIYTYIHTYIHI